MTWSKSYPYLNVESKTLDKGHSPYVKPVVTKSMGGLPSSTSWTKAQEKPVVTWVWDKTSHAQVLVKIFLPAFIIHIWQSNERIFWQYLAWLPELTSCRHITYFCEIKATRHIPPDCIIYLSDNFTLHRVNCDTISVPEVIKGVSLNPALTTVKTSCLR